MKIINGINPIASGIDWLAIPDLAEFWKDHAPANADVGGQRCVWLSRADCSVQSKIDLEQDEENIKSKDRAVQRFAADCMLSSFCPITTVKHLVEKVKLPRDFAGVIAPDHEIPAWMSCLHSAVYGDLSMAIIGSFPASRVREYAGIRTDWVMEWNKNEDRSHELMAMDAVTLGPVITPMLSLYVPGWAYIKDLPLFQKMILHNIKRSKNRRVDTIAISPIIEGTYKNGDYTSGDVVPVEVMRIILQAIADAGAAAVLWGAAANDEQAGRLLNAVQESVVKAAEGVK